MSPPRKIIALIGLRCSGKTSVGEELARILRLPFVDLDREIERLYARTSATLTEATLMETTLTETMLTNETLTDETLADETLADETLADETLADETLTDETQTNETRRDDARRDDVRRDDVRRDDVRRDDVRRDDVRRDDVRRDDVRRDDVRRDDARRDDARRDDARTTAPTIPPTAARPPASTPATAGEILKSQGESAFRELESRALTELLARNARCVLATGGGVVEREENRRALAEHAVCIWLRVEAAELARRMRADATPRPSLTGEDPASEIPKLALRRDPLYAALAHTTLATAGLPPAALAERLARELRAGKDLDPRG
jgi:shikimate kinase